MGRTFARTTMSPAPKAATGVAIKRRATPRARRREVLADMVTCTSIQPCQFVCKQYENSDVYRVFRGGKRKEEEGSKLREIMCRLSKRGVQLPLSR